MPRLLTNVSRPPWPLRAASIAVFTKRVRIETLSKIPFSDPVRSPVYTGLPPLKPFFSSVDPDRHGGPERGCPSFLLVVGKVHPTHGGWLNQPETDIRIFARQCLGKRKNSRLGRINRAGTKSTGSSTQRSPAHPRPISGRLYDQWKLTRLAGVADQHSLRSILLVDASVYESIWLVCRLVEARATGAWPVTTRG